MSTVPDVMENIRVEIRYPSMAEKDLKQNGFRFLGVVEHEHLKLRSRTHRSLADW